MENTPNKNTATLIHLSTFTQYFFPFGNFIFPALIWSLKRKDSKFVDYNGKQALNFQISLFIYSVIIAAIAIPVIVYSVFAKTDFSIYNQFDEVINTISIGNISALTGVALIFSALFFTFKIAEFVLIIYAAVKNSNGQDYTYPFTIKFLK